MCVNEDVLGIGCYGVESKKAERDEVITRYRIKVENTELYVYDIDVKDVSLMIKDLKLTSNRLFNIMLLTILVFISIYFCFL